MAKGEHFEVSEPGGTVEARAKQLRALRIAVARRKANNSGEEYVIKATKTSVMCWKTAGKPHWLYLMSVGECLRKGPEPSLKSLRQFSLQVKALAKKCPDRDFRLVEARENGILFLQVKRTK
jgi:hypothetical protein